MASLDNVLPQPPPHQQAPHAALCAHQLLANAIFAALRRMCAARTRSQRGCIFGRLLPTAVAISVPPVQKPLSNGMAQHADGAHVGSAARAAADGPIVGGGREEGVRRRRTSMRRRPSLFSVLVNTHIHPRFLAGKKERSERRSGPCWRRPSPAARPRGARGVGVALPALQTESLSAAPPPGPSARCTSPRAPRSRAPSPPARRAARRSRTRPVGGNGEAVGRGGGGGGGG